MKLLLSLFPPPAVLPVAFKYSEQLIYVKSDTLPEFEYAKLLVEPSIKIINKTVYYFDNYLLYIRTNAIYYLVTLLLLSITAPKLVDIVL